MEGSFIFFGFHVFSLRSHGIGEKNIKELRFDLKRNMNQKKTKTFKLEVVHFIQWKVANKPEVLGLALFCSPEHIKGITWEPDLLQKLLLVALGLRLPILSSQ